MKRPAVAIFLLTHLAFALKGGANYFPALVAGAAAIWVVLQLPAWPWNRWLRAALVIAGVASVPVRQMLTPGDNSDAITWTQAAAEFCLLWHALESGRPIERGPRMAAGMLGLTFSLAGFVIVNPRLCIPLAAVGFLAAYLDWSANSDEFAARAPRFDLRLAIQAVTLSAAVLLAGPLQFYLLHGILQLKQQSTANLLAVPERTETTRAFVSNATLTSVALERQVDPTGVAIRIESAVAPGYLRGAVYDTFGDEEWRRTGDDSRTRNDQRFRRLTQLKSPPPGLPVGVPAFALQDDAVGPWLSMTVYNSRPGAMYFTSLQTKVVTASAERLLLDDHGVIRRGIAAQEGYTLHLSRGDAPEPLSDRLRERLVALPPNFDERIRGLAKSIIPAGKSARQKAAATEDYFIRRHRYSEAGFQTPRGADALTHFLLTKQAAHCEFFASAAALLLRSEGVPTRYVTGYLATQLSRSSEYYYARNCDAHAWVEAYDDDRQTWFIVEATPDVRVPRNPTDALTLTAAAEVADGPATGAAADSWWLFLMPKISWRTVIEALPMGTAVVALLWAGWLALRARGATLPARRRTELIRLLNALDDRLRRRRLIRAVSETLHQFAGRLDAAARDDRPLTLAADWYRDYARVIYAEAISAGEIERLRGLLAELSRRKTAAAG